VLSCAVFAKGPRLSRATATLDGYRHSYRLPGVATLTISIPYDLRDAVEAEVSARGYSTPSAYVRDLIRRDLDRQRVRALLIERQRSASGTPISGATLEGLRDRARTAAKDG